MGGGTVPAGSVISIERGRQFGRPIWWVLLVEVGDSVVRPDPMRLGSIASRPKFHNMIRGKAREIEEE
jgi:hypothetical protein